MESPQAFIAIVKPKRIMSPAEQAKRIDVIARVLFPVLYGAFNFVYWTAFIIKSYETDENEQASS